MVSLLLVLSQVTQNYCSRTNLRECFRIATGKGEAAEGWGGESSDEPAMDAEACREWRAVMVARHIRRWRRRACRPSGCQHQFHD